MERITNINELKKGDKFLYCHNDTTIGYTFLCEHPDNENYIIAINSRTKEGDKLYKPNVLSQPYYIGGYDPKFVLEQRLKYYKECVADTEEMLKKYQS